MAAHPMSESSHESRMVACLMSGHDWTWVSVFQRYVCERCGHSGRGWEFEKQPPVHQRELRLDVLRALMNVYKEGERLRVEPHLMPLERDNPRPWRKRKKK